MSKFYSTIIGASNTSASRRGNRDITACAQSYNGSVITRLWYNDSGVLCVDVSISGDSATSGDEIFSGTFDEFCKKLEK